MSIEDPNRRPRGRNPGAARRARLIDAIAPTAAIVAALAASPAPGRPVPADATQASVAELKRAYLWCSRAAIDGQLDRAGTMQCSVVYETLKQRAFDGDFDKLYAWSRRYPVDEHASR